MIINGDFYEKNISKALKMAILFVAVATINSSGMEVDHSNFLLDHDDFMSRFKNKLLSDIFYCYKNYYRDDFIKAIKKGQFDLNQKKL